MAWEFKDDRPIYLQVMEQVKLRIISGVYPAGTKLPAVRDLATEASVNPNTMQKALSELEREGFVYSQRTAGRFITEDMVMINQAKDSLAKEQVEAFFEAMQAIGYSREETIKLLTQAAKEEAE